MRIQHLIENKANPFAPLSKIWTQYGEAVAAALKDSNDENYTLLGSIVEKAIARHASTAPERLFSLLKQLDAVFVEAMRARTSMWEPKSKMMAQIESLIEKLGKQVAKFDERTTKQLMTKFDIAILPKYMSGRDKSALELAITKAKRTPKQRKYEKDNERFIFIGRPAFVEKPPGSGNFKKTLEIERLVKFDQYDMTSQSNLWQMKIRASAHGADSHVYYIDVPVGAIDDPDHLEPWMVDLIDEHKTRVPA